MPFVSTPGTHIHYEILGTEGPVVVLIQGLGLSSKYWFDIPKTLTSTHRVVLVDNRGTGQSGRPPAFGWPPWTVAAMADDVAAVLDDARIPEAILCGISMGGMIAQHFALRHPNRARGLILLATSPGLGAATLAGPRALARLLSLPLGGARASKSMVRLLLPPSKWESAGEIFRDWPKALRADPTEPATFAAHLFAASTHYTGKSLAKIGCPVIVAAGNDDILIPKKNAETLARRLPDAELVLLPDAGHALMAEDRDLVRRLVDRLEAKIAARGQANPRHSEAASP